MNKKLLLKTLFAIVLIFCMCFTIICFANEITDEGQETFGEESSEQEEIDETEEAKYYKAKIVEIGETEEKTEETYFGTQNYVLQSCKVMVKEGKYKGQVIDATIELISYYGKQEREYNVGDNVVVYVDDTTETLNAYIIIYDRQNMIIIVSIIIVVVLILLFRLKGIETVGIIAYNILVILLGIFFMYLKGVNPILSLTTIMFLIIIGNIFIIKKFSKETIVGIIGVCLSTVISYLLILLFNYIFRFEGDIIYYQYVADLEKTEQYLFNNYANIISLGMIISSVGIAINMALATIEKSKNGESLLKVVVGVGKDMVKQMNSTVLVFIGMFITIFVPLSKYLIVNGYPTLVLNYETLLLEIIRLFILLINPIIVIPIVALISKEILKIKKTIPEAKEEEK